MAAHRETREVPGAAPIEIFRRTGPLSGPTLAVFGGVHGDEPEGVFAANAIATRDYDLKCGTLVVVPIAHPAAFEADTREAPGGGNLARVFPGNADGTAVERTAAVLTGILENADVLIDLHTAGRHYDMPLLAGYVDIGGEAGAYARSMAETFAADFVWRHPPGGRGRTLSVMAVAGKPAIYTEAPGGGTLDQHALTRFVGGVERVMAAMGLIYDPPPPTATPLRVAGSGNMDTDVVVAPVDGFFVRRVAEGDRVEAGQSVGEVRTLAGDTHAVAAPQPGHVMYLRRTAKVLAGTALAAFAAVDP